jgi:peptidoglycan/xylan/chitin deacetylase (PgdA/CDA1 family)
MSGTFLIGYDVESGDPAVTGRFLESARRVHEQLDAPATLFVVGRTLRQQPAAFARLVDHSLFDLQQHTETHLLLKTVYQENDRGVTVFRGGSPEQVRADVAAAQRTFQELLGLRPIGLTGPYNYYRGLCDRPDLVEIVHGEGIRILRCWGRDAHDWQPTPFFDPFPLTALGFPDVWEYGIHGWQDCILRRDLGWADLDGYFERLCRDLDRVAEAGGVFSYCQHDWSSIWDDPEMTLTARILARARANGMRIATYAADCAERSGSSRADPLANSGVPEPTG